MSYLLVDAADDSVLAEYESLEDVLRIMRQFRRVRPQRNVLEVQFGEHQDVVRFGEGQDEQVGTESIVTTPALSDYEGFTAYV